MRSRVSVVLILLCLLLSGITAISAQDAPLKVVATFSILGDFVQQVAGEHVELTVLVGPDGDSHTYEPTPQDLVTLSEADLIFENGLEFEAWLDDLYAASGSAATRVAVSAGIEPLAFAGHDHAHDEHDHDHAHEDEHAHDDHDHAHEDEHAHDEHAHSASDVTDLSPWAGEWVSGNAYLSTDEGQALVDALAAEIGVEADAVSGVLSAMLTTQFADIAITEGAITYDAAGENPLTCDYALDGIAAVEFEGMPFQWVNFETASDGCEAYRYALFTVAHGEGAGRHYHMRYGSTDFDDLMHNPDLGLWYPSLYPSEISAADFAEMMASAGSELGAFVGASLGIEVAHDHDHDHDHDDHAHDEHDHDHAHDDHGHSHGEFDPHVWHDPNNAAVMVGNIRDALVAADAAHAADYEANADAYIAQLGELDAYIRELVATVPEANRVLITSHDTFGYFADEYGFAVDSVLESVSTEAADPSAGAIAALVTEIRESGVPAIFAENIANPALVEQIASEAGVAVAPTLYTDALGQAGTAGENYLSLVRYNVETIATALGGQH